MTTSERPWKKDLKGGDVILVIPPPLFTRMPSVGVGYLATYLKHKGIKTDVVDLSLILHNRATEAWRRLWEIDYTNACFVTEIADKLFYGFEKEIFGFVEDLLASPTRIIGFSVNQVSIFLANVIAEVIKTRDRSRVIIFGGPATYFKHPRELIKPGYVDYFVVGEGEDVMLSLVERLLKGKRAGSEPGILLGSELGQATPVPSAQIKDLDLFPFPTYEEFDLPQYNLGNDYKPIPLLASRGCIKRCSYCIDHIMWPRFRFRSAPHILKEIEYHCRVNKATAFEFNDLLCNGSLPQLEELCDLIIASGLKFTWVSYAIIRKDMNARLLAKMKQSGCAAIIYGLEHASEKILKKMGKDFTVPEAENLLRLTHEAGINTNINIIVGFPGETEDDFKQVVEFLNRNRGSLDMVTNISGCTLFPESTLGRLKDKFGVSWKEGTDPMLFRDAQGLDQRMRMERIGTLLDIVKEMGLTKSVINRPKLNPLVVASLGVNQVNRTGHVPILLFLLFFVMKIGKFLGVIRDAGVTKKSRRRR